MANKVKQLKEWYRILDYDDMEEKDEWFYRDELIGKVLIGPNNFECILGEPEDANWYRDGYRVVLELNRLHAEVIELQEQRDILEETLKEIPPEIAVCATCGPYVRFDEDGCCGTCGADVSFLLLKWRK